MGHVELRGNGLVLRPPRDDDADAVVAACSDPEIARFIPLIPTPYTRHDAEAWIERCIADLRSGRSHPFVIACESTDLLRGAIELTPIGRIGYWVAAEARGLGIATSALRMICAWHVRRPLGLVTHPDNVASQHVAEKAGFRRVGLTLHSPPFRDGTTEAGEFRLD